MKPIPKMDIDTALSYMSREKAIDLMWRRLFCNADETVNTIAEHDIRKQIPQKPAALQIKPFNDIQIGCPNCENGAIINPLNKNGFKFCPECGQALDWSDCIES